MLVRLVECRLCDGTHDMMLTGHGETTLRCARCRGNAMWTTALYPYPHEDCFCHCLALPQGRLFIVDTGLDEKQDAIEEAVVQRQLRKKARVR